MKTASFRLEEEQDRAIEDLAKKMKIDKSAAARRIIEIGIKEYKKHEALNQVRNRKWTIWKAASYCGESYRSFLTLLRVENIPFPLTVEELQREFHADSNK